MVDVVVPPLGETVNEARISRWLAAPGDRVLKDQPLLEVETDKVETELPCPADGILTMIHVGDGEIVDIGTHIATISGTSESPALELDGAPSHLSSASPPSQTAATPAETQLATPPPRQGQRLVARGHIGVRSPLVRGLLARHGITADTIVGSGAGGRITRDDVLAAVQNGQPQPSEQAVQSSVRALSDTTASRPPAHPVTAGGVREPLSAIRRRTAERMLLSQQTIPQVTTAVQIDFEAIQLVRKQAGPDFKARHGSSLTFLPFVARATVDGLQAFPHLNASVDGDHLLVYPHVHLGIAVDLDFKGLMVPVIRDAQDLRLPALASAISGVARRAREKSLKADETRGSTFTVTNPGGYGTFVGTPLINPPEVAILCVEGVSKQVVVVEGPAGTDAVAIHHVGHLSLTWDHRAVDGAYAAAFLAHVRESLQTRDWQAEL